MTLLEHPSPPATRPASARWAWVCVAFVPFWFAAALGLAMLLGDDGESSPHVVTGTIYALAILAVPFAALLLSLRARRAGAASASAAVVVAAVLLAGAFLGLLLIVSTEAFLVTAGICVAVAAVTIALTGRRASGPG